MTRSGIQLEGVQAIVPALDFVDFQKCSTNGSDSDGLGCDLNCDGLWNDDSSFMAAFKAGTVPGPSGLDCAGTVPCP